MIVFILVLQVSRIWMEQGSCHWRPILVKQITSNNCLNSKTCRTYQSLPASPAADTIAAIITATVITTCLHQIPVEPLFSGWVSSLFIIHSKTGKIERKKKIKQWLCKCASTVNHLDKKILTTTIVVVVSVMILSLVAVEATIIK